MRLAAADYQRIFVTCGGARCLIKKDTEAKNVRIANEAHCLIKEDTVAHGKNHEPTSPRRILENDE